MLVIVFYFGLKRNNEMDMINFMNATFEIVFYIVD